MARRYQILLCLASLSLWPFSLPLLAAPAMQSASQAEPKETKAAASDADEPVYELGPEITPPRIVKQVPPRYSSSKGVRIVGSVTIEVIVTSQGLSKDPRILQGLDKDIDQSALDAVKQWKFDPAKKDGKPVAVKVSLEIAFHSM